MEKIFYDLWNLPATKVNRNIHIFDEFHRTKLPLQEQLLRPLDIRDDILLIFCLIELKVSKAFLQRVTVLKTIRPEIDELTPWLRRMCTLEGIVVKDSRALKQLALAADRLPRECLSLLQKISYLGEPLTIDLVNEITQDMQEIEDEESRYTLSEA
jgi:hypothetical protein